MYIFRISIIFVISLFSYNALAESYWELKIPPMGGAIDIVSSKDENTGIHSLSYEILLNEHTDPLSFYNEYFDTIGFVHFMADTYEKYPEQFDVSPLEKWSSFSANTVDGKFTLFFGTGWKNTTYNSNAQLTLQIERINGDKLYSKVTVNIAPEIDASPLFEIMTLTQKEPISLLKLSNLVGGDPFKMEEIDISKLKSINSDDPFVKKYLELMDNILKQFSEFTAKHVPSEQ